MVSNHLIQSYSDRLRSRECIGASWLALFAFTNLPRWTGPSCSLRDLSEGVLDSSRGVWGTCNDGIHLHHGGNRYAAERTPLPARVKREHSRILGALARLRPAESEKNATFECVKRVLYAFASVLNGSQYHTQVLCP